MNKQNNMRTNVTIRLSKESWEELTRGLAGTLEILTDAKEPLVKRETLTDEINKPDHSEGRGYVLDYYPDGDDGVMTIAISRKAMIMALNTAVKAARIVAPLHAAAKALGILLESVGSQFKELAAETKAEYHSAFDKPHRYGVAHLGNQVADIDSYVIIEDDGYGNYTVPYELKLGKCAVPGDALVTWATKGSLIRWLPEGATMESAKEEAKKMAQAVHPEYNPE